MEIIETTPTAPVAPVITPAQPSIAASDVLEVAADLISAGWCQDSFAENAEGDQRDPNPFVRPARFCALGAIWQAEIDLGVQVHSPYESSKGDHYYKGHPGVFLAEAICEPNPLRSESLDCIPRWNDDPDREPGEILAGFEAAIERARAAEGRK